MYSCLFHFLNERGRTIYVNLDTHSVEKADNNRLRNYNNLNSIQEDYVVVELGYGGDATKRPEIWVDKLRNQHFRVVLFRLDTPLSELRQRCRRDRPDWKDEDIIEGWRRNQVDSHIPWTSQKCSPYQKR